MARLLTSGAELQRFDGTAGVEGAAQVNSGALTIDTGTKRSGLASFKFVYTGAQLNYITWVRSVALGHWAYFRHYAMWTTLPGSGIQSMATIQRTGGANGARMRLNASNQLVLHNDVTALDVGSPSAALNANQWYRIELGLLVPSAGNGQMALYLDGALVASGASENVGNTAINTFVVGANSAATMTFFADDIAINDDTGTKQNSYPSEGKVVLLRPSSDYARTGWVSHGGLTTNLYDDVDNVPPAGGVDGGDSTTTAQIRDINANTTDTYEVTLRGYEYALSLGGGGLANDSVTLVQPVVRFGPATAAATQVGIQATYNPVIAETVGAATAATAVGTDPTGWTTQTGTVTYNPQPGLGANDGPRLKVRKATSAVSTDVDLMGMLVEYVPGVNVAQLHRVSPAHRHRTPSRGRF